MPFCPAFVFLCRSRQTCPVKSFCLSTFFSTAVQEGTLHSVMCAIPGHCPKEDWSPDHLTLEHTWCSSSRHEGKKGGGGPCCSDLALSPALPPQRFFQHTWLVFPAKASSDSSSVPMAFAQIATCRPDSATRSLNSVLSRHSPHSFPPTVAAVLFI